MSPRIFHSVSKSNFPLAAGNPKRSFLYIADNFLLFFTLSRSFAKRSMRMAQVPYVDISFTPSMVLTTTKSDAGSATFGLFGYTFLDTPISLMMEITSSSIVLMSKSFIIVV